MGRPIRFILNNDLVETSLPAGTVVLDFLRRERRLNGTKEGCREGDCGACMVLLGELQRDSGPEAQPSRRTDGDDPQAPARRAKQFVRYRAVTSCLLPLGELEGRHLVSIEGLNPSPEGGGCPEKLALNPIQRHLVGEGAIQCGFCTPGFVVSLTGYLLGNRSWSYEQAVAAVAGNICRCTGYASIKRAIRALLRELPAAGTSGRVADSPTPERPADRSRDSERRLIDVDGGQVERLVELGVVPRYFLDVPVRLQELRQQKTHGIKAGTGTLVAGGTDLFVQKPQALLAERLSFVSQRPELKSFLVENGRLFLGAGMTMEDVKRLEIVKKLLPELEEFLPLIASLPIRNRATLGGNIVNASPIGDFTIILLALGAGLGLESAGRLREVALEDFFQGYKKLSKKTGELLKWVIIPSDRRGFFNFEKVSRRRHLDIASVNSAAWIRSQDGYIQEARLSAGGVAPVPFLLARTSAYLNGRSLDEDTVEQALQAAQEEISPINDVRGSAAYKRLLLRQLLLAHLFKAFPDSMKAEAWI
jgi:xanthine dehydrogenase small subunit